MFPLYEFADEALGVRVELVFPVDARPEAIVLKRRCVPSRVTVGTGAKPPTEGEKLLKDYKQLEDLGQLKSRPGYLTAQQVKAAAALPDIE